MEFKNCKTCGELKPNGDFHKNCNQCKICFNIKRRDKYANNEEHRRKLIEEATKFKKEKALERQKIREEEYKKFVDEHGEDKKLCKYCDKVVLKTRFRHNRLKCKDCERDEPFAQFIRNVRSRIWSSLIKKSKKTKHTIEYLGCNYEEYYRWLKYNFGEMFTFENRGKEWHIDHVIPVSKFDLTDESQQLIAFNWRNTMPLTVKENLQKNNKIDVEQVEQHYNKLVEYHTQHNLQLPQEFIDLYAKHLVVPGNP